ncbi:MAG: hypothetical protein CMK74_02265 [Pseudomonadales bacterium]|jgi:hypothetical protein|nr:hypothetical protein [Pseudomonadales bacterium]|tara:strand:+ start:329 stop:778 length:450 start_codon:yes stop_codon:yes gene_type:complete
MPKYDHHFQGKTPSTVQNFKFFTSGFKRTVGVRGLQKLINQWLKLFMTTKGSDPLHLQRGTSFPDLIGSNIVTLSDVQDVVLLAIQDCNAQLSAIQQKNPPDTDEQLGSATLIKFQAVGADGFDAWVTIKNIKQEEATLSLPNPVTGSV